jgi:hypothetical protein
VLALTERFCARAPKVETSRAVMMRRKRLEQARTTVATLL